MFQQEYLRGACRRWAHGEEQQQPATQHEGDDHDDDDDADDDDAGDHETVGC